MLYVLLWKNWQCVRVCFRVSFTFICCPYWERNFKKKLMRIVFMLSCRFITGFQWIAQRRNRLIEHKERQIILSPNIPVNRRIIFTAGNARTTSSYIIKNKQTRWTIMLTHEKSQHCYNPFHCRDGRWVNVNIGKIGATSADYRQT